MSSKNKSSGTVNLHYFDGQGDKTVDLAQYPFLKQFQSTNQRLYGLSSKTLNTQFSR